MSNCLLLALYVTGAVSRSNCSWRLRYFISNFWISNHKNMWGQRSLAVCQILHKTMLRTFENIINNYIEIYKAWALNSATQFFSFSLFLVISYACAIIVTHSHKKSKNNRLHINIDDEFEVIFCSFLTAVKSKRQLVPDQPVGLNAYWSLNMPQTSQTIYTSNSGALTESWICLFCISIPEVQISLRPLMILSWQDGATPDSLRVFYLY